MSRVSLSVITHGPDETRALGERIGRLLQRGTVVALSGELGAGKTTFTQGLARGLAVHAHVTSPTFTLVTEYPARAGMRLVHMDSYRLGDAPSEAASEAATFGIEEILDDADAVVVIEWAERLLHLLPSGTLFVTLAAADAADSDTRTVTLAADAPPALDVLVTMAAA